MRTAWATPWIICSIVVNCLREFQIAAGIQRKQVYGFTIYVLSRL
jgi:hypothetical protein